MMRKKGKNLSWLQRLKKGWKENSSRVRHGAWEKHGSGFPFIVVCCFSFPLLNIVDAGLLVWRWNCWIVCKWLVKTGGNKTLDVICMYFISYQVHFNFFYQAKKKTEFIFGVYYLQFSWQWSWAEASQATEQRFWVLFYKFFPSS